MPLDPLILSFDTSAAHVAAALVSGDQVLAEHFEERAKGQGEVLFEILTTLLAGQGVDLHDVSALAVGVGPGNFTGIRISVAAARGLSLGLNIPALGVSALDAHGFDQGDRVIATVAAPRDQVYAQLSGQPPGLFPAAGLPESWLREATGVCGSGAQAVAVATGLPTRPPVMAIAPAMAMLAQGKLVKPFERPKPLYLKPADAAPAKHVGPVVA